MVRLLAVAALLIAQDAPRDRAATAVETILGATFPAPVPVRNGARKEYGELALENSRRLYGRDLGAADKALRSTGLIGPKVRIEIALPLLAASAKVQAFYRKGELVLLDPATPVDELVYKLTLAMQDLRHPQEAASEKTGPGFDAQMALAALHHGAADMVKRMHWAGLKGAERHPEGHLAKLAREAEAWEGGDSKWASAVAPRLFVRSADFIWRRGGIFAETLREGGGLKAVEAAFEAPPLSTEQILHPAALGKDLPATVDLAPLEKALSERGWTRAYRTTLGELGSSVLLETHSAEKPVAAAAGWGGDTLLTVEKGAAVFSVWATTWDSPADAGEFHAAAMEASSACAPADPDLGNLVVRRGVDVLFIFGLPSALRDTAVDAAWTCRVRRGDATAPFGRE